MRRLGIMIAGVAALLAGGVVCAAAEEAAASRPVVVMAGVQQWFGVASENIPPALGRQLKLKKNQGLMVVQVLPNSPAAAAGLQPDDLLIEVDGKALMSQEDLARAANQVDDKTGQIKAAKVTLLRDGDRVAVTMTPTPRPAQFQMLNPSASFVPGAQGGNADPGVRTYITPNGNQVNVGTGLMILRNGAEWSRLRIGELSKEKVVLSVATDEDGKTHNSITVGEKTYAVEKDKLGDIPEDIRPLAEQLLKNGPQQMVRQRARSVEERMQDLEKKNQELQDLNKQLIERVDRLLQKQEGK